MDDFDEMIIAFGIAISVMLIALIIAPLIFAY